MPDCNCPASTTTLMLFLLAILIKFFLFLFLREKPPKKAPEKKIPVKQETTDTPENDDKSKRYILFVGKPNLYPSLSQN